MIVGIVGLGLLGGSLARALAQVETRVIAVDPDPSVRAEAIELGVVAEAHADVGPHLAACDVVVLAAPVAAIEALLAPVSQSMHQGAVLTDVAGIKRSVLDAAADAVHPDVRFVAAHPMFGGESGGFAASRAEVFQGGVVAICDDRLPFSPAREHEEAIEQVSALYRSLGAHVLRCGADAHDAAVAKVSHLPYVVSHAVFEVAAGDALAEALAGPGFRGATRLAAFAYGVQGEVARRNPHLPAAIDAMIDRLRALRDALASPDDARRALAPKRR